MKTQLNATVAVVIALVIIIALITIVGLTQRRPKTLKKAYFEKRWNELQGLCKSKKYLAAGNHKRRQIIG